MGAARAALAWWAGQARKAGGSGGGGGLVLLFSCSTKKIIETLVAPFTTSEQLAGSTAMQAAQPHHHAAAARCQRVAAAARLLLLPAAWPSQLLRSSCRSLLSPAAWHSQLPRGSCHSRNASSSSRTAAAAAQQQLLTCRRCRERFEAGANSRGACRYHPALFTGGEVAKAIGFVRASDAPEHQLEAVVGRKGLMRCAWRHCSNGRRRNTARWQACGVSGAAPGKQLTAAAADVLSLPRTPAQVLGLLRQRG